MKTKLSIGAAAGLFTVGAIVQIWAPRLGLTAMLLGVMCGLAAIVIRQQTLLRRVGRHERLMQQLQKTVANGRTDTTTYGASILRRVKRLTDEAEAPADARVDRTPGTSRAAAGSGATARAGAGRAATPDVSNPLTDESMRSMLTPGRIPKVAGVFAAQAAPQAQHVMWIPGDVVASLEREKPEMVLIDEQEMRDAPTWSSAITGAGTGMMRELLAGVKWASTRGVPVYLLPSALPADVHSASLRSAQVIALPLDASVLESAAGAPQTPVLDRLQSIAIERIGADR